MEWKRVACPFQFGGEGKIQVELVKYLGVLFTSEEKIKVEINRQLHNYLACVLDHFGKERAERMKHLI